MRPSGLELRRARRARVRDRVADVGEAADVDDEALEAETEACVRYRAVTAEIAVPRIHLRIEAELGDALVEDVEALLALRAADDLADAGREHVHRGDGAAIVVEAHVERLDLLRVVLHDHRAADVLLGEEALVFG